MKLTLQRNPSVAGATVGSLYVDGAWVAHTLEDEVREIEGQPVSAWKIHGKTAIPSGEYIVSLEDSPRFGTDTLTLHDVPGFQYIRMHAGNTSADTEGCILVAKNRLRSDYIQDSLSDALVAVLKVNGGEHEIEIINAWRQA